MPKYILINRQRTVLLLLLSSFLFKSGFHCSQEAVLLTMAPRLLYMMGAGRQVRAVLGTPTIQTHHHGKKQSVDRHAHVCNQTIPQYLTSSCFPSVHRADDEYEFAYDDEPSPSPQGYGGTPNPQTPGYPEVPSPQVNPQYNPQTPGTPAMWGLNQMHKAFVLTWEYVKLSVFAP